MLVNLGVAKNLAKRDTGKIMKKGVRGIQRENLTNVTFLGSKMVSPWRLEQAYEGQA